MFNPGVYALVRVAALPGHYKCSKMNSKREYLELV
jgi:hypothetical protein